MKVTAAEHFKIAAKNSGYAAIACLAFPFALARIVAGPGRAVAGQRAVACLVNAVWFSAGAVTRAGRGLARRLLDGPAAPAPSEIARYHFLAACPYRSDEEERELWGLRDALRRAGLRPIFEPCFREGK